MRIPALPGALALAALLALAGCAQNPLEDWAYQRSAASAPEQDDPRPPPSPPASRSVNTGPLRSLPVQ